MDQLLDQYQKTFTVKIVSLTLFKGRRGKKKPKLSKSDSFLDNIGQDAADTSQKKFIWSEFYLDPSRGLYYFWLCWMAAAVMYNLLFVIARLAFGQMMNYQFIFFGLDLCNDALYAMDIAVKHYTGH